MNGKVKDQPVILQIAELKSVGQRVILKVSDTINISEYFEFLLADTSILKVNTIFAIGKYSLEKNENAAIQKFVYLISKCVYCKKLLILIFIQIGIQ